MTLELVRSGDTLIINGDPLDLSGIPDGATLPAGAIESEWIAGDARRSGGVLHVTLLLPDGPNPDAAAAFPADILDPLDGPLAIPGNSREED